MAKEPTISYEIDEKNPKFIVVTIDKYNRGYTQMWFVNQESVEQVDNLPFKIDTEYFDEDTIYDVECVVSRANGNDEMQFYARIPAISAVSESPGSQPMTRISTTQTSASVASSQGSTQNQNSRLNQSAFTVQLQKNSIRETSDIALWASIRKSCRNLSFESFENSLLNLINVDSNHVLKPGFTAEQLKVGVSGLLRALPYNDTDLYRFLKVAVEAFFLTNATSLGNLSFDEQDARNVSERLGRDFDSDTLNSLRDDYLVDNTTLPYFAVILNRLGLGKEPFNSTNIAMGEMEFNIPENFDGILEERLTQPLCIELIWSYWQEEGMLVQSMNRITQRFQNIRSGNADPLANMEMNPLRPLNNILWGYIQDEQHRLSVSRRAHEYDHHYGMTLHGKALNSLRTADSRSKFIEGFHNLLYLTLQFYTQDDEVTVNADSFSLVNALRDLHMIMSEGAHNQFGDLPATARQEMILQQWLLARPEFREFLPSRSMVAYPENWMPQVDAMKNLQSWADTSVTNFSRLATLGEPLLLSVRYGNWSDANISNAQAANWARYWRQEIQGYVYAYRTVTGVDLSAEMTDSARMTDRYLPPTVHLQRQLAQQRRNALPAGSKNASLPSTVRSKAQR